MIKQSKKLTNHTLYGKLYNTINNDVIAIK